MDEQMYLLMAKVLSNEATGDERRQLQLWLDRDAANKETYETLKSLWAEADTVLQQPAFDTGAAWEKVAARTVAQPAIPSRKSIAFPAWARWSAAAAVLLLAAGSYTLWNRQQDLVIVASEERIIELPDHSKVTLHKGSKLTYPKSFDGDERHVTLHGDAFFEVARNEQQPFIIAAQPVQVQVLGTSFHVTCHDSIAHVVVATGKVQVSAGPAAGKQVILTPGGRADFRHAQLTAATDTNANYYKTGTLAFTDRSFAEVLQVISLVKDTAVSFDPAVTPALRQQLISVRFAGQDLEAMLTELCLITGARWQKTDKGYIITAK